MRIRLLFILFIGIQWNYLPAQDNSRVYEDSILAYSEFNKISKIFDDGAYEEANVLIKSFLVKITGSRLQDLEARSYFLKGKILQKTSGIDKGIPYFLRAAGILEKIDEKLFLIDVYTIIAKNYFQMQAYNKALEYYQKQIDLPLPKHKLEFLLEKLGVTNLLLNRLEEADDYLNKAINQTSDAETKANRYYLLSKVYRKQNRLEEEILCYKQIFEFKKAIGDTESMALIRNNMAYVFQQSGQYMEALNAFQDAYDLSVKSGIPENETGQILANIGVCYQAMGQTANAVRNLQQAEKNAENSKDYSELARLQNMIANIYYKDKDLYNAGVYSETSIITAKKSGNRILLAECYRMFSQILKQGNDYINALNNYEKHLIIRDSLQREKRISEQELSEKILALEKEEKELRLKLKEEEVQEMLISQLRLKLEKEAGEKELLLRDSELAILEKDKIKQQLLLDKQNHEAEIRKRETRQLEQQNKIKDLEILQKEREKEAKEQEITILETHKEKQNLKLEAQQLTIEKEKAARQRTVWISILSGLTAIIILLSFINARRKNKLLAKQKSEIEIINTDLTQKNEEIVTQKEFLQQANEEINLKNSTLEQQHEEISSQKEQLIIQKDLIELKNEEITSSINYAQRIQSAIIPSPELMVESFSDFFVLFMPRDIVSGDFYWFGKVEDNILITAADCTGHGVPGAFMSMLGVSYLREIVLKEYITHPGIILKRMRKEVINSLQQSVKSNGNGSYNMSLGNVKDGMDMALVSINLKTNELQFSGANNPFYIIRRKDLSGLGNLEPMLEGDFALYEIKGDKMPVAIYERMDNYQTSEIQLFEGDLLILFSDGYADQFGGPKGKKFMYKTFKKLLLNIANLPLNQQNNVLKSTIIEWKGDLEQVDDITVVGVRI